MVYYTVLLDSENLQRRKLQYEDSKNYFNNHNSNLSFLNYIYVRYDDY